MASLSAASRGMGGARRGRLPHLAQDGRRLRAPCPPARCRSWPPPPSRSMSVASHVSASSACSFDATCRFHASRSAAPSLPPRRRSATAARVVAHRHMAHADNRLLELFELHLEDRTFLRVWQRFQPTTAAAITRAPKMPATTPPTAPAGIAHASPPHARARHRSRGVVGRLRREEAGSPPACTHCASGAAASTATGQASRGIQRRTTPLWGSGSLRSVCSRTMRALPSAPSGSMMSWAARIPHAGLGAADAVRAASPTSSVLQRHVAVAERHVVSASPDAKLSRSRIDEDAAAAGVVPAQSASGGTA